MTPKTTSNREIPGSAIIISIRCSSFLTLAPCCLFSSKDWRQFLAPGHSSRNPLYSSLPLFDSSSSYIHLSIISHWFLFSFPTLSMSSLSPSSPYCPAHPFPSFPPFSCHRSRSQKCHLNTREQHKSPSAAHPEPEPVQLPQHCYSATPFHRACTRIR